jgi:hypothetical protein
LTQSDVFDPAKMQISFLIHKKPRGAVYTANLMREVLLEFERTGKHPRGMTIKAVQWNDPGASAREVAGRAVRTLDAGGGLRVGVVDRKVEPNMLMLDFDNWRLPRGIQHRLYKALRLQGLHLVNTCYIRTRKGWHIEIRLHEKLEPLETVALQSIMGSDCFRESLNLLRVRAIRKHGSDDFWKKRWNLLYSGKLNPGRKTARAYGAWAWYE